MTASLPERAYRISRSCYAGSAADALSGLGGVYEGGRWHSQGQRIVYTGTSAALCLLERLAHSDEWLSEAAHDRVLLQVTLPSVSFLAVTAEDLDRRDPTWRTADSPICRRAGDRWLQRRSSCALIVPSAVSPDDLNILLNPEHPDFDRVLAASADLRQRPLRTDPRVSSLVEAARKARAK